MKIDFQRLNPLCVRRSPAPAFRKQSIVLLRRCAVGRKSSTYDRPPDWRPRVAAAERIRKPRQSRRP
jgi:hypothetical protein